MSASFPETQACIRFEDPDESHLILPQMVSLGDSSLGDGKCQGLALRGVYPPWLLTR